MDLKEWLEYYLEERKKIIGWIVKPVSLINLLELCKINSFPEIKERQLRKTIKQIPQIVSTSEGYYIAKTKEEVEASLRPKNKMAISLLVHNRKTKEAYPEFYPEMARGDQLELFVDLDKEKVEWK